jgi:lipoprotein-releasing system permease protein
MRSLSWQLAWRYLRRHPERRTLAFAAVVSVAGVSLGVAALIVVMGVLEGLEGFISESVLIVDADLVIAPVEGPSVQITDSLLEQISGMPGVAGVSPYIEGEAVVRLPSRGADSGCRVRGVDPAREFPSSGLLSHLVYADSSLAMALRTPDGYPCTILGLYLADELTLRTGDTLVFFPPRSFFTSRGFSVGRAIVVGAVETGLPVNDRAVAYVPLELARSMYLPDGGLTGVSIRLSDPSDQEGVVDLVSEVLPPGAAVRTWQERNPSLTASMELERAGSFAAILLITLVATFNIVGTIARSVVERRRDISILKAMGASRGLVLRIFLWEGVLVGLAGVLTGLALGLASCWVLGSTDLVTIPDVYSFHQKLPVQVSPASVIAVCLSAFGLSLVSGAFPALKAASLDPVNGLRG